MPEPLVSVLLPVYNCEPFLDAALDSLVNQTYKNLEIIAVDDGSTDKSWEILQARAATDKRIRPFRNDQNLLIAKTLNRAVEAAKGEFLARMDSDDIREPDSIAKQVKYMQDHPDTVIVGGTAEFCDENMNHLNFRRYLQTDEEIRAKIFRYSPFCHASLVFRASAMEEYKLAKAEDYDLYFRLAKKGKLANLPDTLYKVRTHKASTSQSSARYQEKLTLYIRLKAVFEYGYQMSTSDKAYFAMQFLTMWLMPPRFRFWLFSKIRGSGE